MGDSSIWVQITGIVALLFVIAGFQFNQRSTILWIQTVGALVWTAQYLLLGAYTGAGVNIWSAVRNAFFYKYRDNQWVLWLSMVCLAFICMLSWKNWVSILPMIGSVFATLAIWQRNPSRIRMLSMMIIPFWLAYDSLNGSVAGIIGNAINFTSLSIGILRFDILPMLRRPSEKPRGNDYIEIVEA